MVLTTHYAQLRKAHPQGRLGKDEPPFPLTRRRAETREAEAMTDMIDDILMGWLLLAAVALVKLAAG